MTSIMISSGHGKYIRGASGYIDEVEEARNVVNRVAEVLHNGGTTVTIFHDDVSTTQSENLNRIVDYHNAQERELDVSVHFNAYEDTSKPMGCEVLYVTEEALASSLSTNIANVQMLPNRGGKYRDDLFFLNETERPAILIETCFVDSLADSEQYRANFDMLCETIAAVIGGNDIVDPPPPTPDVADNRVKIKASVEGDITVIINGTRLRGEYGNPNSVNLGITMQGEVTLTINGQDFHNEPSIPPNQIDITASTFGGSADPNCSAYDEEMMLNDTDFYIALPDRFESNRPLVRVHNRKSGVSALAEIWDVGPWDTDDPYWETGTRPQAESGTDEKGRTTNKAGIDLSPALARQIGVDGMGMVDWEFI